MKKENLTIKHFSIIQAIRSAFKIYFKNWRFFFTLLCIVFFINLGIDLLTTYLIKNISIYKRSYDLFNLAKLDFSSKGFLRAALWLVIFLYFALLNKLFLKNFDNQYFKFNELIAVGTARVSYFITSFVYHIIVAILFNIPLLIILNIAALQTNIWFYQFLLLFGFFLILIFSAIFIAAKYMFADLISLEKQLAVIESYNKSSKLTSGRLAKLTLIFFLAAFIGILAFEISGAIFFFAFMPLLSIFSKAIGYSLPDYFISIPINTFLVFFIFEFIFPIVFLIKISIYNQLIDLNKRIRLAS